MGGRGKESEPIEWTGWASHEEVRTPGKSRVQLYDPENESAQAGGSHWPLGRQEKPLARPHVRPYRKPTQVGRGNSPQVNERPSVKELGKLTPYLRKKGCPSNFFA